MSLVSVVHRRTSRLGPLRRPLAGVAVGVALASVLVAAARVPAPRSPAAPPRPGPAQTSTQPPGPFGGAPDSGLQQTGDPNVSSHGDGPPIIVTCAGFQVPATIHVAALVPRGADGQVATTPSPLACRYEWDFGDPAGRWNVLPGWNAAHAYDVPGAYNVTLTVTDPTGRATRRTTSVRIAADDRQKIYVSAEGNDGQTGATPATAVRSAARAFQLGQRNADVLFRRGDVFEVGPPIPVNGQNLYVGNYSAAAIDPSRRAPMVGPVSDGAALPVLKKVDAPAKQTPIFLMGKTARDVTFDGLLFDSKWGLDSQYNVQPVPARAINVGGENCTVRNCSFRNLTDGLNTEFRPTGVLLQDCTFSDEMRAYGYYGNGTDHVIVGNVMVHSRTEHLIRCSEPGVQRLLIAYNDLSRPTNVKGGIELRCANWFYVADNYVHGGTMRVGPQDDGVDQRLFPDWASVKCTWGVVQDNRIDGIPIQVRLGSEHVMVRNNVVRQDQPQALFAFAVACAKPGWDQVRKIIDVTIENNTGVITGEHGYFVFVVGTPVSLTIRNNLFVAPAMRQPGGNGGAVYASGPLDGFQQIENNVYPAGPGGAHHVSKAEVPRAAWTRQPMVRNERYESVPLDANDNPPAGLGAGARMGNDKREREAKRAAGQVGATPTIR